MKSLSRWSGIVFSGVVLASTSSLQAQIFVNSSITLGANDSVVWSQLAPPSTLVGSGTPFSSPSGLAMTVSAGDGGFMAVTHQGSVQENGWDGNFTPGEALLFNQVNGIITISFAQGIYGAGAQVDADNYGNFNGTINAYGASDNLLGSFVFSGISSGAADGSAVFAGILSSTPDIYGLSFAAPNGSLADFTIGTLELNVPVPEPTIMSFALFLLPFGMLRTLRKPRTA